MQMIYRLVLSLLLALQLSFAGAVPSHAHVSGELMDSAAGAVMITPGCYSAVCVSTARAQHYSKAFKDAGITKFEFVVTPTK